MIAPKIKEVDSILREDRAAIGRVYEVHPEVAFWRLNGERALDQPKKVKGTCYAPGLTLRRARRRSRTSEGRGAFEPRA
jgi:predicted RNase H-like nuclease